MDATRPTDAGTARPREQIRITHAELLAAPFDELAALHDLTPGRDVTAERETPSGDLVITFREQTPTITTLPATGTR